MGVEGRFPYILRRGVLGDLRFASADFRLRDPAFLSGYQTFNMKALSRRGPFRGAVPTPVYCLIPQRP